MTQIKRIYTDKISKNLLHLCYPRAITQLLLGLLLLINLSVFSQTTISGHSWLKNLPDSISIGDINLPGSHDAVAINKHHNTPYSCHSDSLVTQLDSGIRLLDIRIKVKGKAPNYIFGTCHGAIFGGKLRVNEYQSLTSVLDECRAFLKNNPTEFIVMMLKLDDWNGKDHDGVFNALDSLLFSHKTNYPMYSTKNNKLPTLGQLRGKIYLISRIDDSREFGVPVKFPVNKAALVEPDIKTGPISLVESEQYIRPTVDTLRDYPIYIQDQFEKLLPHASAHKFELVKETFGEKKKGDGKVVLNYSTARRGFGYLYKVYIHDSILNYLGSKEAPQRPATLGWLMLDYDSWVYPSDTYGNINLLKVIISSNFKYEGYEKKFKVVGSHQ